MNSSLATREAQATLCLEAAERHQGPLVALAVKLAGSKEAGMDLFQEVVLNCHDAIQHNGFAGDKYQFYLRAAIHNHFKRTKKREARTIPTDFQELMLRDDWQDGDKEQHRAGISPEAKRYHQQVGKALAEGVSGGEQQDASYLAQQVQEEITRSFGFADRIIWRLHVDGIPTRDIAAHLHKGDHTSVWRRLDKMKDYLRGMFQQTWDALHE